MSLFYVRMPLTRLPDPKILTEKVRCRAKIGRTHWRAHLDMVPDSMPYKKDIATYCKALQIFERRGLGLLLYGSLGSGKTSLGTIALKYCLAKGGRALSFRVAYMLDQLISFKPRELPNGAPLIEGLENVNLLLLDDLEKETDRRRIAALETVIRARYDDELPTIITTNLKKEDVFEFEWLKSMLHDSYYHYKVEGINWRALPPSPPPSAQ